MKRLVCAGRNRPLLLGSNLVQQHRCFQSSTLHQNGYHFEGKDKTELVRDFIHDSLYNPDYGYFNKKEDLIISHPFFSGKVSEDIANNEIKEIEDESYSKLLPFDEQMILPFYELEDHLDYLENLSELYQQGPQSWGTPIEIFQPYYGIAIAEYMLRTTFGDSKNENPHKPLKIYEMGGGMGTCSRNVLDYLEKEYPEIYKRTEYHIIEISSQLHEQQKKRCSRHVQSGKLHLHHASFMDWKQVETDDCFVIAMEVLDNCAHDKVSIDGDGNVKECHVFVDQRSNYYGEVFLECRDDLIVKYLSLSDTIEDRYCGNLSKSVSDQFHFREIKDVRRSNIKKALQSMFAQSIGGVRSLLMQSIGGEHIFFIPTVQLQIIEKLKNNFPKHRFICADFDYLATDEPGETNRPLVQKKFKFMKAATLLKKIREKKTLFLNKEDVTAEDNFSIESHAFRSYLVPKGECDIFFATDFAAMQKVYGKVCHDDQSRMRGSMVMKSSQFMSQYAQLDKFTTKSGYNPLLKDYSNFSFFLS